MSIRPVNEKFSLIIVIIACTSLAITNVYVIESVENINPITAISLAGLMIFQVYYAAKAFNKLRGIV